MIVSLKGIKEENEVAKKLLVIAKKEEEEKEKIKVHNNWNKRLAVGIINWNNHWKISTQQKSDTDKFNWEYNNKKLL